MVDLVDDSDVMNMWEEWADRCTAQNKHTYKIKLLLEVPQVRRGSLALKVFSVLSCFRDVPLQRRAQNPFDAYSISPKLATS